MAHIGTVSSQTGLHDLMLEALQFVQVVIDLNFAW